MVVKRRFCRRINDWLTEPAGETFRYGKWRFWLPLLLGFSILNAILTGAVFSSDNGLHKSMSGVLISVGALLAWAGIGALHYSDSSDARLARGVSALDSGTLVFVIAHFCFLLWVYGHISTLKNAEAEYMEAMERYNITARAVSGDNAKIAQALVAITDAEKQRAGIEQDTAYQLRQAAKHGARIKSEKQGSAITSISTSPIELAKPPAPRVEPSAAFLVRWDYWVRMTNLGELVLAAVTLIFIRNRSAIMNANAVSTQNQEPNLQVPDSPTINSDTGPRNEGSAQTHVSLANGDFEQTHVSYENEEIQQRRKTTKTHEAASPEGLKRLRDALKEISARLAGISFKADVKEDCVWIRGMLAKQGRQKTLWSVKANLDILAAATTMSGERFRKRLEQFLRKNKFEI